MTVFPIILAFAIIIPVVKTFLVLICIIFFNSFSYADEKDFEKAARSIDAVIDASFVSSSSFFMIVKDIRGGTKSFWEEMAESMCGGRSRFGIGRKVFGISVFDSRKKIIAKAYCG